MFNRRELLMNSILTGVAASLKVGILRDTSILKHKGLEEDHLKDFVEYHGPLSPRALRHLRWEKRGVITVFSPDETRVVTLRQIDISDLEWRVNDTGYVGNADTGGLVNVLRPMEEWGRISFGPNGANISVRKSEGSLCIWDGKKPSPPTTV